MKDTLKTAKRAVIAERKKFADMRGREGVSVIICTNRPHYMDKIFENFARQKYEPKEMVLVLNKDSMELEEWRKKAAQYGNVKVFQLDEQQSIGACLNYAADRSSFEYLAKIDDDNYYAPEFLGDLMNAFHYTDAAVVGKYSYFMYFEGSKNLVVFLPGKENCFVDFMCGSAFVFKKEVFERIRFAGSFDADSVFIKACVNSGIKMYAIDRFNYVCIRRADVNDHTWKPEEKQLMHHAQWVATLDNFIPYITV